MVLTFDDNSVHVAHVIISNLRLFIDLSKRLYQIKIAISLYPCPTISELPTDMITVFLTNIIAN